MNPDRHRFYSSIALLRDLLSERQLIDTLPVSDPKNVGSQALRRGLTVATFAALERYLEAVVDVMLKAMATATLPYASFPTSLKKVLTIDAVAGLATRIAFLEKSDRQTYAELEIARLASFSSAPPAFSPAGFSPRGSNIGHEDIKSLFVSFGVGDPWAKLASLATLIGASRLSLLDDFRNFSAARNKCAHDPSYVIASNDLDAHLEACATIAMSVDILAMKCATSVSMASKTGDVSQGLLNPTVACRFVDQEKSGAYVEQSANGTRAYRRYSSLDIALANAKGRKAAEAVVARDTAGKPFLMLWAPGP